jgi:hypothetical protein
MFVLMGKAFDRRTATLAIVCLGTLFMMAPGTIRGAFLRLDWLALLVMATCCLKLKRYKTAGALAAYAGAARLFPLAFAFGLAAKCLWQFAASRRIQRRYLEFFVTFALVILVLITWSLVSSGGMDTWQSFWTKIHFHDTHMSVFRVGFKPLLLAGVAPIMENWPRGPTARAYRFDDVKAAWWAVQGLVLLGVVLAVRRLEDYEALTVGYVIVYFFAAPTYYYQVVLLVPVLLFLPKRRELLRAHGMALLFGISVVGYILWIRQNLAAIVANWHTSNWQRIDYVITLSLDGMLLVFSLYVLGFSLYRSFARRFVETPVPAGLES